VDGRLRVWLTEGFDALDLREAPLDALPKVGGD
jgi:hypothetical protein